MRKLIVGVNDLATIRPDLVKEWHLTKNGDLKPTEVTCGMNKKVWWLDKFGHEWEALISSRAGNNRGCPVCAGRVVLAGFNDLESQFPEVAKEWDYELNNGIMPSQVIAHSNKKYYWKCNEGHSYESIIDNRVNGSGCPYCAGKAVLRGFNDFESNYSEMAKEWDYELNKMSPFEITSHSHKKYHWICSKCGYKWQASADNRSRGHGCPKCANNKAITGYNDVCTSRPDLMDEWNYERNVDIDPKRIAVNSHKKVWWKCRIGHEWKSTVESRTRSGNGCPYCRRYLRTSFPEQAILYYVNQCVDCINTKIIERKEIDVYIESMKVGIEYDGLNWHKDIEKDIEKNVICFKHGIQLLRVREKGCPEMTDCEYYEVVPGNHSDLENAICWIFKKLGLEAPDVNIERDRNCIISNYAYDRGHRSLAFKCPELLSEWDYEKNYPLTPDMITYGSHRKVWWKCRMGHVWDATVSNRTKMNKPTNCPYCTNRRRILL